MLECFDTQDRRQKKLGQQHHCENLASPCSCALIFKTPQSAGAIYAATRAVPVLLLRSPQSLYKRVDVSLLHLKRRAPSFYTLNLQQQSILTKGYLPFYHFSHWHQVLHCDKQPLALPIPAFYVLQDSLLLTFLF